MAKDTQETFSSDFKRFFGRGMAVLLPSMITLWILWQVFVFVYANVGQPINQGIRAIVVWGLPLLPDESLPAWYKVSQKEITDLRIKEELDPAKVSDDRVKVQVRRNKLQTFWNEHWYLSGLGLLVAIMLIYLAGVMLGGLIGRRMYGRLERLISRIPGFKQVYPHVKQVVDLILGDRPRAFRRVVMVEYPRKGIWTVGLVTGDSMKSLRRAAGQEFLCVFIPSTPTPFTGFTINVRREEAIDLGISIDEAVRYFITGGVLVPQREADVPAAVAPPALESGAEREDEG